MFYDKPPLGFTETILSTCQVQPSQPKEEKFKIRIKVRLTEDGLVEFNDTSLLEDYIVKEKVVKKKEPVPV